MNWPSTTFEVGLHGTITISCEKVARWDITFQERRPTLEMLEH
jgi:hypothetical protein